MSNERAHGSCKTICMCRQDTCNMVSCCYHNDETVSVKTFHVDIF